MSWHLNVDRPVYTRHPTPRGWGNTVTSTWQALALSDDLAMLGIAVHEAGHAAMMLQGGIRVVSMTVYSQEEARDQPCLAKTVHDDYSVDYHVIASALAAGERAQDRWLQQEKLWTPERAWAVERHALDDRAELEQIVSTQLRGTLTYGRNPSDHFDYANICDRTDQALVPLWGGVLALAGELARRKTLTGGQVTAVLAAA